ncbi:Arf3p GTPase activating protein [Scheffersomyces coipomensis]|uniref:Arf3p GTPase activating protein n=1 Tax=Scheffersomyces coipomensis TaxID=1788519 RepID=UPI00315C857F
MSSLRKKQKDIEKQLIDIINARGNDNKCGECGTLYPTWASVNLGILLCGRCSSIHKRILAPKQLSNVKSLTLDTWSQEQIDNLKRIGNKKSKRKWNSKRIPFPYDADNDVSSAEQYIREKYILGKFRDDNIENNDYDDRSSRYSDDNLNEVGSNSGSRRRSSASNRSRSNSNAIPRLSHRKLTNLESNQYNNQASKIMSFGYENRETIVESLLLSNGSIDVALDILDQDGKLHPNGIPDTDDSNPPQLPRRPGTGGNSTNGSAVPSSANSTTPANDWWNTAAGASGSIQPSASAGGAPQIYQYTDPVTGQVSYIDANGQQYLDPTNPQHQQQILLQSNPQLMAQQTSKNQILSLYSQPNQFTTNVAEPVQPGGIQQQQTQQQAQQQQQLQQPAVGYGQAPNQAFYQYGQPTQGQPQYGQPQQFGVSTQFTGFGGQVPGQQAPVGQFNGYGQPQAPPSANQQQFGGWR